MSYYAENLRWVEERGYIIKRTSMCFGFFECFSLWRRDGSWVRHWLTYEGLHRAIEAIRYYRRPL